MLINLQNIFILLSFKRFCNKTTWYEMSMQGFRFGPTCLKISFSTFWFAKSKCTETDLKKSQIWLHSGVNPGIRNLRCQCRRLSWCMFSIYFILIFLHKDCAIHSNLGCSTPHWYLFVSLLVLHIRFLLSSHSTLNSGLSDWHKLNHIGSKWHQIQPIIQVIWSKKLDTLWWDGWFILSNLTQSWSRSGLIWP